MAQATTFPFGRAKLLVGDGATPTENFTALCGLNSRALTETKNFNEVDVPDCDDEDLAAAVAREVRSTDWNISGEGVLADEAIDRLEEFWADTASRNIKFIVYDATDTPRVTKAGRGWLSTKTINATRGEKVTIQVEVVADGALTTTVA